MTQDSALDLAMIRRPSRPLLSTFLHNHLIPTGGFLLP